MPVWTVHAKAADPAVLLEVVNGVDEGAEVVSSPYNVISKTLKDGMKVKVVPKEKLFTVAK